MFLGEIQSQLGLDGSEDFDESDVQMFKKALRQRYEQLKRSSAASDTAVQTSPGVYSSDRYPHGYATDDAPIYSSGNPRQMAKMAMDRFGLPLAEGEQMARRAIEAAARSPKDSMTIFEEMLMESCR